MFLLLVSLIVAWIAVFWVRSPGYMDADYYFAISSRISSGSGFSEPFIWNYLTESRGVPHPSHQYWMPMASIVALIPQTLFGSGFQIAQVAFLLLTAVVPLITTFVALQIGLSNDHAYFAGWLAIFSGFFLPFSVTTDTFSLFMVIGGLFFVVLVRASHSQRNLLWLVCGFLIGVAHLSRADGILFLVVGGFAIFEVSRSRFRHAAMLLLGYVLAMSGWWLHNWESAGTLLSTGSLRVLWLGSYDELFSFPASLLTPEHLWSQGLGPLVRVRLQSLLTDLQSLFVVNGMVFLGPLMLIGGYHLRGKRLVRYGVLYLLLLLFLMSVVFPFAGARGGFFHSSAALMPLFWALTPVGLQKAIQFGVEQRNWDSASAYKVFRGACLFLAAATTIGLFYFRTIGSDLGQPAWNNSAGSYRKVGDWFRANAPQGELIAINNPPGLFVSTGLSSVVIPNGGPDSLLRVIDAYGVDWLVLDQNNPGLSDLYRDPISIPWLDLQTRFPEPQGGDILIFRVDPE